MNLPEAFSAQTQPILQEQWDDFLHALTQASPVSVRVNDKIPYAPSDDKVAWCDAGYYLAERPLFTADPYLHAGVYYVQEASSMFLWQVLSQIIPKNSTVLDLSAAPGGKSTLISQYLGGEGLLVSNEIVRSRAYILAENTIKWGNHAVVVTNNEPNDFQKIPRFFDAVVVDAPCSGEGMFRKDAGAIDEWSEQNVQMCAARQRDILSDVWSTLKEGGVLIYSTCTYNTRENEENVRWIMEGLGAEFLPINTDSFPEITVTEGGYRFFPHKTRGEGFFLAAMRKIAASGERQAVSQVLSSEFRVPSSKFSKKNRKNDNFHIKSSDKEIESLKTGLIYSEKWKIYSENGLISVFDAVKSEKLDILKKQLKVLHFGITLAEQKGRDFIPHVSLALSKQLDESRFVTAEVDYDTAIAYLRKETVFLPETPKGFILLKYKNVPIGWVKNVGNRCNNLYPNEWRIRMNLPTAQLPNPLKGE